LRLTAHREAPISPRDTIATPWTPPTGSDEAMTETQGRADAHLPAARRVRTTDGTRADVDRVLFERFLDPDDPVDLHAVVERFLPLARGCAARYAGRGEPFDDVFQVACVALLKAIRRYDGTRGGAFSSYAVPTIVGEIKRYFRDRTWSVRPPRDLLELSLTVAGAYRELERELSREPTVGQIGDRLHRSDADVVRALQARHARQALSLEAPCGSRDGPKGTLGDLVSADEQGFARVDARVELGALARGLKQRDRLVLYLRFGEDLTQKAIGDRIGISQMQVSRILRSSIRRLSDRAEQSQCVGAPSVVPSHFERQVAG
jgi:RNA polymerase sigma-B factor